MPLELPPQAHHPAPPWRHLHPAANTNTNTSGHNTGADISNDVTFLWVRCTQRYLHISSPWRWRACRSWTCAAGWWEWERMAGPERRDWSSPPTGCPGTPAGSEWRDASATSWPAQEPDRERGGVSWGALSWRVARKLIIFSCCWDHLLGYCTEPSLKVTLNAIFVEGHQTGTKWSQSTLYFPISRH